MLKKLGKDDFENYRLYGEVESINRINGLMEKTDYWVNRETDILPSSDSQRSYDKKRAVIAALDKPVVQEFFKEYEDTYFPDLSKMTPMEKIDNVLTQFFNMHAIKYSMEIENYRSLLSRISYEVYPLVNQTAKLANLKEKQDFSNKVESPKEITPLAIVKNALAQGITQSQVYTVNRIEQSKRGTKHIEEEGNER